MEKDVTNYNYVNMKILSFWQELIKSTNNNMTNAETWRETNSKLFRYNEIWNFLLPVRHQVVEYVFKAKSSPDEK